MITCAGLVLFLVGTAAARPSDSPVDFGALKLQVRQLIRSPLPRDQAWGAYLIGELNLSELAPELTQFIKNNRVRGFEGDEEFALQAALDSLIRLGVSVSPDVVAPYSDRMPAEVITLLAEDVSRSSDLIAQLMRQVERPNQRHALAGLMLEAPAHQFGAWLIDQLEITATLAIVDPMTIGGGGGISNCRGVSSTCRTVQLPRGYPPMGVYELGVRPLTGSTVLAIRSPTYWVRRVARHDSPVRVVCRQARKFTTMERLGYLAILLDRQSDDLPLRPSYWKSIAWSDDTAFNLAVSQLRTKAAAAYRQLALQLLAADLIDSAAAARLQPIVQLRVIDHRMNPAAPLPSIDDDP